MRTLLICHEGATLDEQALPRWLGSFSHLVGIVILRERPQRMWRRIRRELERVGIVRFMDVVAFRAFYKLFLARQDQRWEAEKLRELAQVYPPVKSDVPVLRSNSPNSPEAERFIRKLAPDIMLARCKTLLKEQVFSLPSRGTFVMHPGICPEYRNAHGCFWALANRDLDKVGMTLLRIDKGIDTGQIYGYYSYAYDERNESHAVIQERVVVDNLEQIKDKLIEISKGVAIPVNVQGRASAVWGQPWLTRYLKWKYHARRRLAT